jgi:phosphatidylglycerol:prolipoprotein diacylglycerol transferase
MTAMRSPVLLHQLLEIAGYLTALTILTMRSRRGHDVVDRRTRYQLMIAAGIGAMIGARLLAALCDPGRTWAALASGQLAFGKTIVGGLLGGLIAVELVKKRLDVRVATGDPLVLPLALGIAIGRVGCFLAASVDDTAGAPSTLPWAVRDSAGVARHPVALYEIAFVLLLVPIAREARSRGIEGDAFKAFLGGYLLFRFFVDFLKPLPPPLFGGVSAIQLACLAGLAYYVALLARRWRPLEVEG